MARDVIRAAVANVFTGYFPNADIRQVVEWFDLGGNLQIDDTLAAAELLSRAAAVQGLCELAAQAGIPDRRARPADRGSRRLRPRGALRAKEDQSLR